MMYDVWLLAMKAGSLGSRNFLQHAQLRNCGCSLCAGQPHLAACRAVPVHEGQGAVLNGTHLLGPCKSMQHGEATFAKKQDPTASCFILNRRLLLHQPTLIDFPPSVRTSFRHRSVHGPAGYLQTCSQTALHPCCTCRHFAHRLSHAPQRAQRAQHGHIRKHGMGIQESAAGTARLPVTCRNGHVDHLIHLQHKSAFHHCLVHSLQADQGQLWASR